MLVLAIDTSTPDLIVGIVDSDNKTTLGSRIIEDTREHNEPLTPLVQETLAEADKTFADLGSKLSPTLP